MQSQAPKSSKRSIVRTPAPAGLDCKRGLSLPFTANGSAAKRRRPLCAHGLPHIRRCRTPPAGELRRALQQPLGSVRSQRPRPLHQGRVIDVSGGAASALGFRPPGWRTSWPRSCLTKASKMAGWRLPEARGRLIYPAEHVRRRRYARHEGRLAPNPAQRVKGPRSPTILVPGRIPRARAVILQSIPRPEISKR